jgi:aconitate hydratase/homoaconitate hydratase
MTLSQKILAHRARGLTRRWVAAGDVIRVGVSWTIASELAWGGMDRTHERLGRPAPHDPKRVFLAVDHTADPVTLAHDPRAQRLQALARKFASSANIRHFYDANTTILHTKFYRELVQPGQVVLGADSHTTSHGGLGAFAIGLGGADVTAAMVLGESWLEVPEAIRVDFAGEPEFGLSGKDIVLEVLRRLRRNTSALERSVEYGGAATHTWSADVRFTIANMTAELGGLNGIFEADGVVAALLARRAAENGEALYFRADPDAPYVERHALDLTRLEPLVAKPFSPDNVAAVGEVAGLPLDGCFIGACTTTEEELVLGALVLEQAFAKQPRRAPSPKQLMVPGDLAIRARLQAIGLLELYEHAGFRVGPPGCSMCLGVASERALPGEVWLSSQNRNYENRMGQGSLAYLASAATVAASARAMRITDPRPHLAELDRDRYARLLDRPTAPPNVPSQEPRVALRTADTASVAPEAERPDAPDNRVVRGRVQRFGDHVDTDAIIPGPFCHLTDPKDLGAKAFHFVRPEFPERVRSGRTVLVAGEAFGSGSSREQAAWALLGAGVHAIVAKSFAFIHKRNLVNEAVPFLVVRDPAFHAMVEEDSELEIDLVTGALRVVATGRTFHAEAPSPVIRALREEGGLVEALARHGTRAFERLCT